MNADPATESGPALLTSQGRVLLALADDPTARLRDLAAAVGVTERSAQKIVNELVRAGYISRCPRGRRNEYRLETEAIARTSLAPLLSPGPVAPVGGDAERRFRSLVERIPAITYIEECVDSHSVEGNPNAYISPQIETILGYAPHEWTANPHIWRERLHPDDRERVLAEDERTTRAAEPYRADYRIRSRDGRDVWIRDEAVLLYDDDGTPMFWLGLMTDETERRRMDEQLRRAEELYRLVVENSGDLIVVRDLDQRVVFASASHTKALGFTPDELAGERIAVHPDDAVEARAAWLRALIGHASILPMRLGRSDGSWLETEASVVPIYDGEGSPRAVMAVHRDLSERRRLEVELRQAQKLEAVGRLAGGVAHDFNNMLTAISGYAEVSLARVGADDPIRRNLEEIARSAERSARLTRQLLAYSRRQVLQPRVIDLNSSIEEDEAMLRHTAGQDAVLEFRLAPDLWLVEADPTQIEEALASLVASARDAMPAGGRVLIETQNTRLGTDDARRRQLPPGPYVCLAVSDTGVGMDQETLAHVFEPFFAARGQGTGLNLAMVYGIVKQSGGHIEAESTAGAGTRFAVYLPRAHADRSRAPGPGARSSEAAAQGHTSDGATILLVEDEQPVRLLIREMLERDGHRVLSASNPREAVAAAGKVEGIDLVVTDVVLPELSGHWLVQRLRERIPAVAALYVSGYDEDAVRDGGAVEPGAAFLAKPFSAKELTACVRGLLDRTT